MILQREPCVASIFLILKSIIWRILVAAVTMYVILRCPCTRKSFTQGIMRKSLKESAETWTFSAETWMWSTVRQHGPMELQHGHAERTCSMNKQLEQAVRRQGHGAWAGSIDMHHWHVDWTSGMDSWCTSSMEVDMQQRNMNGAWTWARTCSIDMQNGHTKYLDLRHGQE